MVERVIREHQGGREQLLWATQATGSGQVLKVCVLENGVFGFLFLGFNAMCWSAATRQGRIRRHPHLHP